MIQLDTDEDYSANPQIAAQENNVFIVWQNVSEVWVPYGNEVLMKISDDKGASFGNTLIIDGDTGSGGYVGPDVAVQGRWLYLSWWHSNELGGPPDVYVQRGKIHEH